MVSSDLPATSEVILQTDASKQILDAFLGQGWDSWGASLGGTQASELMLQMLNAFNLVALAVVSGMLRELVMMKTVQLELIRKNNELLDRLAVIASLDYLTRMERTTDKEMEDSIRAWWGRNSRWLLWRSYSENRSE